MDMNEELDQEEDLEYAEPIKLVAAPIEPDPDNISSVTPATGEDDEKVVSLLMLDPEAAKAAREARRPNISWLKDAILYDDKGLPVPVFDVGDKIVIERRAGGVLRGAPWLDTQTYVVESIDDDTGLMHLWNRELCQRAYGNYITGPASGDVYKLAPNTRTSFTKKKRGRPKKNPEKEVSVTPPSGEKKKRGRPKGSKNRSRDEINSEKAEKRAAKMAGRQRSGTR